MFAVLCIVRDVCCCFCLLLEFLGCLMVVACFFVVCCLLFVACFSFVVCCLSFGVCCVVRVVYGVLLVVCSVLSVVRCLCVGLLYGSCCTLFVIRFLFVAHGVLRVVVVCCLLFAACWFL